ncbi:MAG: isoaspartyl peptidase/L-asparaginase family protein [Nitrospinota bacterium]
MKIVFAHAGAGNRLVECHDGLMVRSVRSGLEAMEKGGAEEAVIAAVEVLEDAPETNAGLGSSLNLQGEVEMDASIMIPGDFGAVAGIRGVKSPVRVAWAVLRECGHKILVGEGAAEFARVLGLPFREGGESTQARRESWEEARLALSQGERLDWEHSLAIREGLIEKYGLGDTVGALALDDAGRLAAAGSTGGLFMKLPGRAGDTPVPGAGLWCTEEVAVVCTGYGEAFIRTLAARRAEELYRTGGDLRAAVETALEELFQATEGRGGILALSREGGVAAVYNSATLPIGAIRDGRVLSDFHPEKLDH